jgi:hypothetical protein
MLAAVSFYYDALLNAGKVGNKRTNGTLST